MAENKKSFLLYADLIHTVRKMPKDKAGELFMTILSYVNDENPVVEDMVVDLVFEPIKRQMKRDLEKYEHKRERLSQNGRAGGLKSGEVRKANEKQIEANEANASKVEAKEAVTVNDTVTVTVTDTVINNKRAKALVVAEATTGPTKSEYQKIVDEFTGKDKTTVVIALKEFIAKRPEFAEPYVDYFNIAVEGTEIPTVRSIADPRRKKVKARVREPAFDYCEIIKKIRGSHKLKHESSWFSFDWIFHNQTNYIKIIEGNYDN